MAKDGVDGKRGRGEGAGRETADFPALRRGDWGQSGGQGRAHVAADVVAALVAQAEPGARLGTKEELRAKCGVSVGTFNETLRLLQARALVTVRPGPGGGLFAAEQSPMVRLGHSVLALDSGASDVSEAVRIRNALDPLLIEDALWHASPADIQDMRIPLREMQDAADAEDPDAFIRANWRLHARIAAVSPNTLLRSLYLSLLDLIEKHALAVRPDGESSLPEHIHDRCRLHTALIDALDKRDREEAMRLIAEHTTTRKRPAG
ncbi:FadR/GntR family transcriptional regulator [Streptomyces sp. NPDC051636]|uniref:FadR/GntR family transcriptional regulator n=1 Tax=Streptomyces sp. NPDC051636 TaxID=3365663 RepID=UPI0037A002C6